MRRSSMRRTRRRRKENDVVFTGANPGQNIRGLYGKRFDCGSHTGPM